MIDFQNGDVFKLRKDRNPRYDCIEPLLIPGETIIESYTSVRDYVVFTDKRIISVNVQGVTGKKKDYTSLPYKRISVFSIETSGVFDLDTELELYFSGVGKIRFEFTGGCDVRAISQVIAKYALD